MASGNTDGSITIVFTPVLNAGREEITWKDGELEGQPYVVSFVRGVAASHRNLVAVTPTGPFFSATDALGDIQAFVQFMKDRFEEHGAVDVHGKVPLLKTEKDLIY